MKTVKLLVNYNGSKKDSIHENISDKTADFLVKTNKAVEVIIGECGGPELIGITSEGENNKEAVLVTEKKRTYNRKPKKNTQ